MRLVRLALSVDDELMLQVDSQSDDMFGQLIAVVEGGVNVRVHLTWVLKICNTYPTRRYTNMYAFVLLPVHPPCMPP
jgi:hypothetical protein